MKKAIIMLVTVICIVTSLISAAFADELETPIYPEEPEPVATALYTNLTGVTLGSGCSYHGQSGYSVQGSYTSFTGFFEESVSCQFYLLRDGTFYSSPVTFYTWRPYISLSHGYDDYYSNYVLNTNGSSIYFLSGSNIYTFRN